MLLPVKTAALATITALSIALTPAAPAYAWGQREQDVLKGVLGTIAVQAMIREAQRPARNQPEYREPVYRDPVYPAPTYHQPRAQTSIYSTPAAKAFQSYSLSERRLIQKRLAHYGYYRGGIDGSFGPGTYSAVVAYASDEGERSQLRTNAGAFGVYDGLIY